MLGKCHNVNFSIEETEDGYAIHIKGDKEKIKAKLEAMEAYRNYKVKAKEAGIGFHGFSSKFFSHLHDHFKEAHQRKSCCSHHAKDNDSVIKEEITSK